MNELSKILAVKTEAIDPGFARVKLEFEHGKTIQDMADAMFPQMSEEAKKHLRVTLVTENGRSVIPPGKWDKIKPRLGCTVVMRLIPADSFLKPVLQIVVAVAAIALGQLWAIPLAGFLGVSVGVAAGLIGLGVTLIGNLLINALFPARQNNPNGTAEKPNYAITGWRNPTSPGGQIPAPLGFHRFAPPFAAGNYTEIVGDLQYVRAIFCAGYGPLDISDIRIGDTPITSYTDVQVEVRNGYAGDLPVTLYTQQVIEERFSVELRRDYLRSSDGTPIEGSVGAVVETNRVSASNATQASVIFQFPAGLIYIDDDGNDQYRSIDFQIRQRPVGGSWSTVIYPLTITAKKKEGFFREYRWNFPARGQYEIAVSRVTPESLDTQVSDRSVFAAMQSLRPEYPLNLNVPMAIIACRIKATYQLNGTLENLNFMAKRICPDYDVATDTWITRATNNPASLFRWALQGPANAKAVFNSEVDLDNLKDWHNFCRIKGLRYNRLHDFESSLLDTLMDIAAAGRAAVNNDGVKWGVIIDRPSALVIDHINPRNSRDFTWSRNYVEAPDAFRVNFIDETDGYQNRERIVPWPGFVGEPITMEALELPGKTDPSEIWRESRRRQYEVMYRPDRFQATQDGAIRTTTRGDLVMGSYDALSGRTSAFRVTNTFDGGFEFDGVVEMEAGVDYGIQYMVIHGDGSFDNYIRQVNNFSTDPTSALFFTVSGTDPIADTAFHFGPLTTISLALKIAGIEAGEDMSSVVTMVEQASIIDTLTDAEVPPTWIPTVGDIVTSGAEVPAVPIFERIASGTDQQQTGGNVLVGLRPGSGSSAILASYVVAHRLVGTTTWSYTSAAYTEGAILITAYSVGDDIEIQAKAVSVYGVSGSYTASVFHDVAGNDIPFPDALPEETISVVAGLGSVQINFNTGSDAYVSKVQVYRNNSGVLNRATDASGAPIPVGSLGSYARTDGDNTRVNEILNGDFASGASWVPGTGWTIASGKATHVGPTGAGLQQNFTFVIGQYYRYALNIAARTVGTLQARLLGGTTGSTTAHSGNGDFKGRILSQTGNNKFELLASATFDGDVDNVILYKETGSCLPQGTYYYWFEGLNENNAAGPVSAVRVVTVV